ncbi:LTA synthase family protein [Tahibacter sp.]|uniref:LTA synthase family protein n=1 Tax=Tahibacter sp. TaxID=2056211 RepID=UPI0028C40928|nr:LTA synthase family protein [Tahibacter sp.]
MSEIAASAWRARLNVAATPLFAGAGWTLLVFLLLMPAAWLLDPVFGSQSLGNPGLPRLLVGNALPAALLALGLLAVSGRPLASLLLAGAAYAALVIASTIKLEQLGLPLLPADFRFLSLGGGATLFWHYVALEHVALLAALLLAAALAAWREPRRWRPSGAVRLLLAALVLFAGSGLWHGSAAWRAGYDGWSAGFEPWTPAESVARLGVATNLLMFHWELVRPDRQPPDRDRVLEFVAEHAQAFARSADPQDRGELPDIVVVQSESFFDPARLNGVDASTSLPNFRRLAAATHAGELRVPTFAGGTIRTEFEVLSGVPLAAFPGVEYPYFELVDAPMPGLMRTLVEQGYRTSVVHPNDAAFWNRREALRHLGAQRFLALPEFRHAPKSGLFVADAALTDQVLAELADDGPPQFLLAISMEAHGPYEVRPGLDENLLAAIPLPDLLDEYGARTLRHFLYHLANADHELGRLADVLQARSRPTVLLFYGDHLPGLHSAFAQLGFVDGQPPRTQPVPYLILDNRGAVSRLEHTRSWMLPAVLLEAAGVPPDAYLALVGALRQQPAALLPGNGSVPEPRFAELARLRVRDEFDLGEFASALDTGAGNPAGAESPLPDMLDEAAEPAAN